MSGNSLIIDTNIALYFLEGDTTLYYTLDGKIIYLSFITELELLSYPELTKYEESIVNEFINDCIVIDINKEIKKTTIELRNKYRIKIPDALIAATACYLRQPFITADKGFKKVDRLNLIFYEK